MQYNRQPDGELLPLPKPSVDTGMGLERIAAILQGVHSNYEIDIFVNLIKSAAKLTNTDNLEDNSLKVIADHIRSVTFMLSDGVIPSNEGRGYVLRRIIRRAIRHGYKLNQKELFFYKLVSTLVQEMGEAYPNIKNNQAKLEEQIKLEEERFAKTLEDGMNLLEADLKNITNNTISGETLFKLYDTYGFPVDLTADIARERELKVDLDGYNKCMQEQRKNSQKGGSFKTKALLPTDNNTKFLGYEKTEFKAEILEIFIETKSVESLKPKENAIIILDQTPFYGESGGQVGDTGFIRTMTAEFIVTDTQKQGNTILHIGYLKSGELSCKENPCVEINTIKRDDIKRNHSATHLLHSALREILGNTVEQKGSLVTQSKLRFDFTYDKPLTKEELEKVELLANNEILANHTVIAENMTQEQAMEKGAMALFGEKYGDVVRVLTMGDKSVELCGGTHILATGSIGQIIITSESGVAAGVRRIEAVTGLEAISYRKEKQAIIDRCMNSIKANPANFENKIAQLLETQKDLQKQIKTLRETDIPHKSHFEADVDEVNGISFLTSKVEGYNSNELRDLADKMRDQNNLDIVLLATEEDNKVKLVITVSKQSVGKLHAGKIIAQIAQIVDGRGGGRPDFAQAGGNDISKIDEALHSLADILKG